MTSCLITGGSGALGTAIAKRLLENPRGEDIARIIVFSRGEYRQHQMAKELEPLDEYKRLRFFIGDVRDRDRLRRAMERTHVVIHAAALKRIEVGHYNPVEMVKTNVLGSINVVEAAQDAGVAKVVGVSSDKAYQPVSPYGCSKAMMESLFLAANSTSGWEGPRFSVCRYGNVWNSTGSVVPVWREILRKNKDAALPVTDPECTRFFMRMSEAVDLVLETARAMKGGETAIPNLPAFRLHDLAVAMDATYRVIGLPRWEKLHESMSSAGSSADARRMTVDELMAELETTP
jgi:FlaA1/EpsC-like NDP-sugar epimerase